MAKITANGAHKIVQFDCTLDGSEGITRFVLCSDGRVLRQWVGLGGYSVYGCIKDPEKRTAEFLRDQLTNHRPYTIVKEK